MHCHLSQPYLLSAFGMLHWTDDVVSLIKMGTGSLTVGFFFFPNDPADIGTNVVIKIDG